MIGAKVKTKHLYTTNQLLQITMNITPEVAKQDLEKVIGTFQTIGPGSEQDRAAQMVLQTIQVLQRKLGSPDVIKM